MRYVPFLLILLIIGCRDPIDLKLPATDPRLVIDGFITDEFKPHSVFVSFSSGFDVNGIFEARPVENAIVTIEDNEGDEFNLTHLGAGEYRSTSFFAEEDKAYRVVVQLEGEEYATEFERLPENDAPNPSTLSFAPELRDNLSGNGLIIPEEGAVVKAEISKTASTVYYQWIIQQWYAIDSPLNPGNICYIRDFDIPRVVVLEDQARQAGEGENYEFEIDFVPVGIKTKLDFGIYARQLIITQEAFEFWNGIKEQAENVGSLFDSAPFTIIGNAFNTRTDEPVLGYFGVYRESIGTTFISEAELPYGITDYPCNPPPVVPNICTDCGLRPGKENLRFRPRWWR